MQNTNKRTFKSNSNKSIIFDKKDVRVEPSNLPPSEKEGAGKANVDAVLNKRYNAVVKNYQKLLGFINEYITQCEEGMQNGMYFLDPEYRPSLTKSEIISIITIADPHKKTKPGSATIMLRTKTFGVVPGSQISDYPLPQVKEFAKHIESKLKLIGVEI